MSDATRPRYKSLEGRRIAQVQLANHGKVLLIRFTDGGKAIFETSTIETNATTQTLRIKIYDGYKERNNLV